MSALAPRGVRAPRALAAARPHRCSPAARRALRCRAAEAEPPAPAAAEPTVAPVDAPVAVGTPEVDPEAVAAGAEEEQSDPLPDPEDDGFGAEEEPEEDIYEYETFERSALILKIKLKSYDVPTLKEACDMIVGACEGTHSIISGPIPFPTKRRIYCVLRSPHVNSNSREHFETRTHQRLIHVKNVTKEVVESLMDLSLPAGVDCQVKL